MCFSPLACLIPLVLFPLSNDWGYGSWTSEFCLSCPTHSYVVPHPALSWSAVLHYRNLWCALSAVRRNKGGTTLFACVLRQPVTYVCLYPLFVWGSLGVLRPCVVSSLQRVWNRECSVPYGFSCSSLFCLAFCLAFYPRMLQPI